MQKIYWGKLKKGKKVNDVSLVSKYCIVSMLLSVYKQVIL